MTLVDVSAAASGWIPGLEWRAGRNAYYRAGRIIPQIGVDHFTVGTNSTPIGDDGYFTFLIPKDGPPQQFAEWDAVTWHACEWNVVAWGIEFERLSWDEPLTASQIAWGGYLVAWLYALAPQVGLGLHSVDRLPVGSPYTGYANHEGLAENACDEHYDGVTDDEWRAILVAGGLVDNPTDPIMEDEILFVLRCNETQQIATVSEYRVAAFPIPELAELGGATVINCTKAELDAEINARAALAAGHSPGGSVPAPGPAGPTEEQVRAWAADEIGQRVGNG